MFQKGDYVILKQTATYNCKPLPGYFIQLTNPIECSGIIVINNKRLVFSLHEILRPAVLSDWAVEIPEHNMNGFAPYRFIVLGKDGAYKYFMTKTKSLRKNQIFKWIYIYREMVDALSTHYRIPIMPYKEYKRLMEAESANTPQEIYSTAKYGSSYRKGVPNE